METRGIRFRGSVRTGLCAPCGGAVYDARIILHVTLNTISNYAKKCRPGRIARQGKT